MRSIVIDSDEASAGYRFILIRVSTVRVLRELPPLTGSLVKLAPE